MDKVAMGAMDVRTCLAVKIASHDLPSNKLAAYKLSL